MQTPADPPLYQPLLHVVLHQPEIPPNTGTVGRTCVAIGAKLWLVRPLGFQVDQKSLRRAGLDYWQHLEWEIVDNWAHLMQRLQMTAESEHAATGAAGPNGGAGPNGAEGLNGGAGQGVAADDTSRPRMWMLSKKATRSYLDIRFQVGDVLVFGCETAGLPDSILDAHPDTSLRIPIRPQVRSLNLSCAVGVVAFEAMRQLNQPT